MQVVLVDRFLSLYDRIYDYLLIRTRSTTTVESGDSASVAAQGITSIETTEVGTLKSDEKTGILDSLETSAMKLTKSIFKEMHQIVSSQSDNDVPLSVATTEKVVASETEIIQLSQTICSEVAVMINQEFGQITLENENVMNEIRYLIAALVDEILLYDDNMDWIGRDTWYDYLIEDRLFQSDYAGRAIFQKIQSLANRFDDTEQKDQLATIYLMMIQLGFRGELRHSQGEIVEYAVFVDKLRLPSDQPNLAFPQAYNWPLSEENPHTLDSMNSWWKYCGIAVIVYLLMALAVWWVSLNKLENTLEKAGAPAIASNGDYFLYNNNPNNRLNGKISINDHMTTVHYDQTLLKSNHQVETYDGVSV